MAIKMEKIEVWSIQKKEVIDILLKDGKFETKEEFVCQENLLPYNWMKKQISLRLGVILPDKIYPIWIWVKRPDLRGIRYFDKGTKGVLLKLRIDKSQVLLSDFYKWHAPFTKSYLAKNEFDSDQFEQLISNCILNGKDLELLPIEIKEQIINSWERVFDYNDSDSFWRDLESVLIQGVIPKITISDLVNYKIFTSR